MNAEVICGAVAGMCHCGLQPGHDGPHECANRETCNGAWVGDIDGPDFDIIRWPGEIA